MILAVMLQGKLLRIWMVTAFVLGLGVSSAKAERTNIAVASNFTATAKALAEDFKNRTGHDAILSFGSTGKLYAQITKGAPFDVFLSADQVRPEKLGQKGYGVTETLFTYARGEIVFWSRNPELLSEGGDASKIKQLLEGEHVTRLAIANPKTAPYGVAARGYLQQLLEFSNLGGKIVYGENIAQTYQFAYTGNAELAIVAKPQTLLRKLGSSWEIPPENYALIKQDAILLKRGQNNEAARSFMNYLSGKEAAVIIEKFGYTVSLD